MGYFSVCFVEMFDSNVIGHNEVGAILSVSTLWGVHNCNFINNTALTTDGAAFKLTGEAKDENILIAYDSVFAGNSVYIFAQCE